MLLGFWGGGEEQKIIYCLEFPEATLLQALQSDCISENKTAAKTFISDALGETYIYQLKVRYKNKAVRK